MNRDDAEDLFLATLCQAPAYIDYGLIREQHLSARAKAVYRRIRYLYDDAGWDVITREQLDFREDVLRSIPARLARPEAQAAVKEAETCILDAWSRSAYALALRRAAEVAEGDGLAAADRMLWDAQAKIRAASAGIEWRTAADSVKIWLAAKQARLELKDGSELGSGFGTLDLACDFYAPKRCTLIQGYTGDGKSTLTLQILDGLAIVGIPTYYISHEDEDAILGGRLVAIHIDDADIAALLNLDASHYDETDIAAARALIQQGLDQLPFRYTHRPDWTVEETCAGIIDAGRNGARVIAVDYIQKQLRKGDDPAKDLIINANAMKTAAGSVGAHLILVSQIIRPEGTKRAREDLPPPTLFSAHGGAVETAAEAMLCPFRRNKDKVQGLEEAQVIIPKAKVGPSRVVRIFWDTARHIYVSEEQQRALSENGWRP